MSLGTTILTTWVRVCVIQYKTNFIEKNMNQHDECYKWYYVLDKVLKIKNLQV